MMDGQLRCRKCDKAVEFKYWQWLDEVGADPAQASGGEQKANTLQISGGIGAMSSRALLTGGVLPLPINFL